MKNQIFLVLGKYCKFNCYKILQSSCLFQNSLVFVNKLGRVVEFIVNLQLYCDLVGGIFNGFENQCEKLDEYNI